VVAGSEAGQSLRSPMASSEKLMWPSPSLSHSSNRRCILRSASVSYICQAQKVRYDPTKGGKKGSARTGVSAWPNNLHGGDSWKRSDHRKAAESSSSKI